LTQQALAENAECPDPDNEICCGEKDIIKEPKTGERDIIKEPETQSCLEVANEGYSCVPNENCDNQLDVRGTEDYYYGDSTPTCDDDSQTCCHKDKIIESEPNLCADHIDIGFRCVIKGACNITIRGDIGRREDLTQQALAENAECPDPDNEICCGEKDIIKEPKTGERDIIKEPETQSCLEVANEGYSCVPNENCDNQLDVRGTEDYYYGDSTPTCDDDSQTCCHKDKIIESEKIIEDEPNLCGKHSNIGFSCVPKETCDISKRGTMPRKDLTQEALAEEAECSDPDNEICCNEKEIISDTYDQEYCSDFESDGYRCVPNDECNDVLNVRGAGDTVCKDASLKCCHESRLIPPNLCEDHKNVGYSCVPEEICDRRDDVTGPRDDLTQLGLADFARCPDLGSVCCHGEHVIPENDCSSYADENYACTKRTDCLDKFFESTDEGTGIDIRGFDDSNPALATCPNDEHVCCKKKKNEIMSNPSLSKCPEGKQCVSLDKCNDEPIITNSVESTFLNVRSDGLVDIDASANLCPVDNKVCCTPRDVDSCKSNVRKPQYVPKCGKHNSQGEGIRISNPFSGKEATQFGEWPHACILYRKITGGRDDREFLGGASIITPGIVITATHKVIFESPSQLFVRCGEWNRYEDSEHRRHQDRNVKYISNHPRYSGVVRLENDVSLLHLTEEFNLDPHLDTICLPELIDNREDNYDKEKCVAMGWGKTTFNANRPQNILKQVTLPILDNDVCQNLLRKTRLGPRFDLDETFICAGGKKGADACRGDGGGSLVCPHKKDGDKFVLAGLVAWGIGCGRENVPGAYAAIPDQLCFIDWATKCKHGNDYNAFYDYSSKCGDDWIDKQISQLQVLARRSPYDTYLRKAKELKDSCRFSYTPGRIAPEEENKNCPTS